jgi:hypothetical protein
MATKLHIQEEQEPAGDALLRPARLIWLATGAVFVASGLVAWMVRGERVFSDLILATLAWCF